MLPSLSSMTLRAMFCSEKCCIKRLDKNIIKFDAKSDEGILPGYASTKKAYRCYNLRIHKIVESTDVKVDDIKTNWYPS
jgi:hypothetical protein